MLSNVEDEATFERFMEVVGRIPSIDTEDAREKTCSMAWNALAFKSNTAGSPVKEKRSSSS